VAPQPAGAIVRIAPREGRVRPVDRTIVAVAAGNDGRYSVDAHLGHDPSASERFAEAHVRRLEAMRRRMGNIERGADGSWLVAPDHLDKVKAYEALRLRDRPVTVETLSHEPLERLVEADAATWLGRELVASSPEPLRDAGFGRAAREAQARRRQWLIAEQLAEEREGALVCRPDMLAALRRRELLRVAGRLSDELGLPFAEAEPHELIEGRLV